MDIEIYDCTPHEREQKAREFIRFVDERKYRDAMRFYNGLPPNLQEELRKNHEVNWRYRITAKASRLASGL